MKIALIMETERRSVNELKYLAISFEKLGNATPMFLVIFCAFLKLMK